MVTLLNTVSYKKKKNTGHSKRMISLVYEIYPNKAFFFPKENLEISIYLSTSSTHLTSMALETVQSTYKKGD